MQREGAMKNEEINHFLAFLFTRKLRGIPYEQRKQVISPRRGKKYHRGIFSQANRKTIFPCSITIDNRKDFEFMADSKKNYFSTDSAEKKAFLKDSAPKLVFENTKLNELLSKVYDSAVHNLISINIIECNEEAYGKTGLVQSPNPLIIRAGGDYNSPWTRDASINSWSAASLLAPDAAQNTLWAVCDKTAEGKLVVQRDKEWWDKVIWITAAWSHFLITGNKDFLRNAYEASLTTLDEVKRERYNEEFCLFTGPSFFNDGIAGYPIQLHQKGNMSSAVIDHPDSHSIMALSTNCVYYNAYRTIAFMGKALKEHGDIVKYYENFADMLFESMNEKFWIPEKGRYGYLIYGNGSLKGELDTSQEGMGLSMAILFGIADEEKTQSILRNTHSQPKGIPSIWPHFEGLFSDERPGRHNGIIWPLVNGFWAHSAAMGKRPDILAFEVENIASIVVASNYRFYEIYDSISGDRNGGWQCGWQWDSCIDQTWSATSYLRAIINGLFGICFEYDGIRFQPCLPQHWGNVSLMKLKYREMVLNIHLRGRGVNIKAFSINGKESDRCFIPSDSYGEYDIYIDMI